ncbi:MAG: hypothetical protein WC465_04845 [Patescibacteria group bacterium]
MAYKLTRQENSVIKDNKYLIPFNSDNNDYREYLAFLASGGIPAPRDADPLPTQDELNSQAARADAKLQNLASKTPAQIKTFVNSTLTLATQADKDFIASIAVAIGILYNQL